MTNKEILQADMLDILFEYRNKLYGAYALRKTYSKRLGTALGIALSLALLFILMSFIDNKRHKGNTVRNDPSVIITNVIIPDEPKEPEQPKEIPKPKTAQVDYQVFKISKDDEVTEPPVDISDILKGDISNVTTPGDLPDDIVKPKLENGTGSELRKAEPKVDPKPILTSRNPEFPGGTAAWLAFLQRYLQVPEDLDPGQRIEVQVRFWVDIDGKVSRPEIIKSGGNAFDKEVLRVLKKMPKWEPAIQNGNFIAVPYTQPVIFMGVEE